MSIDRISISGCLSPRKACGMKPGNSSGKIWIHQSPLNQREKPYVINKPTTKDMSVMASLPVTTPD